MRQERWGPRTLDVDVLLVGDEDGRRARPPGPASADGGAGASCSCPSPTSIPTWAARVPAESGVRPTGLTLPVPSRPAPRGGWNEVADRARRPRSASPSLVPVAPGRARARTLVAGGWRAAGVAGRSVDAPAVDGGAPRCAAARGRRRRPRRRPRDRATPDAAIEEVAAAIAPGLEPARWCCTSPARARSPRSTSCARRDPTSRSARCTRSSRSRRRLRLDAACRASWCAVDGPPEVDRSRSRWGCGRSASRRRARRAITRPRRRFQPPCRAARPGGPARRKRPASRPRPAPARARDARQRRRPRAGGALTGPVPEAMSPRWPRHLAALPDAERAAYRAVRRAPLASPGATTPPCRDVLGRCRPEPEDRCR